ncbi:hypothetical protein ACS0TY_013552 [Phlomoides rotata]
MPPHPANGEPSPATPQSSLIPLSPERRTLIPLSPERRTQDRELIRNIIDSSLALSSCPSRSISFLVNLETFDFERCCSIFQPR